MISVTPAELEPIALRGGAGARQALSITWIARSSILVDFAGKLVLTDPWFTETSEYYHGEPHGGPETDEHLLTYNGTPYRFLHSLIRLAPDTVGRVLDTGQKQTFV